MLTKKIILYWFSAIIIFVSTNSYSEESFNDDFSLSIGGYSIMRYDSTMSLTDKGVGAGFSISPEDTLGWNTEQTVFRIDGHYRFNSEHSITVTWYSIDSSGNKVLTQDIEWVDKNGNTITIPTGARVDSKFNYDIYKVGYLWSFYNSDKVELAAGAGLHVSHISVELTSDTTSSGIGAKDAKSTVPLPVLSFLLNYSVNPKMSWYLNSEYFSLAYDQWYGVYNDTRLGIEYRAYDKFGVGASFGGNGLKLIKDTSDSKFKLENRMTGVMFYLKGYL